MIILWLLHGQQTIYHMAWLNPYQINVWTGTARLNLGVIILLYAIIIFLSYSHVVCVQYNCLLWSNVHEDGRWVFAHMHVHFLLTLGLKGFNTKNTPTRQCFVQQFPRSYCMWKPRQRHDKKSTTPRRIQGKKESCPWWDSNPRHSEV